MKYTWLLYLRHQLKFSMPKQQIFLNREEPILINSNINKPVSITWREILLLLLKILKIWKIVFVRRFINSKKFQLKNKLIIFFKWREFKKRKKFLCLKLIKRMLIFQQNQINSFWIVGGLDSLTCLISRNRLMISKVRIWIQEN